MGLTKSYLILGSHHAQIWIINTEHDFRWEFEAEARWLQPVHLWTSCNLWALMNWLPAPCNPARLISTKSSKYRVCVGVLLPPPRLLSSSSNHVCFLLSSALIFTLLFCDPSVSPPSDLFTLFLHHIWKKLQESHSRYSSAAATVAFLI